MTGAKAMAEALAGVTPSIMKTEIDFEMARRGKLYSIHVLNIRPVRAIQGPPVLGAVPCYGSTSQSPSTTSTSTHASIISASVGSEGPGATTPSHDDGIVSTITLAVGTGSMLLLVCLVCCVVSTRLRKSSVGKTLSECNDVNVKVNSNSIRCDFQTKCTVPRDAWSEASTDIAWSESSQKKCTVPRDAWS